MPKEPSSASSPSVEDAQLPAVPLDDDDQSPTLTASALAPKSSASSAGMRSIPSVPRIGIPRTLKSWDRYEVLEVIGAGGMGAVYKARDPRLSRFIALKIVHPGLGHVAETQGEFFVRRFMREARLQASLDHPHICKVYEIGELPPNTDGEAGYPYIAMQLIGGKPLHQAQADMTLFDKVRVIKQVAEALHTAHKQGLIHRDIKPSNIMVERTEDGKFHPYVMDFGLARETTGSENTRSSVIEGTPRFMSPEQARGDVKHLDRRTDVYSLGITLYELLVGQSPFQGTAEVDILVAVLTAEPRPLRSIDASIPIDLEAITLHCIEKEQAARYDSAKALADDLGRYLDGEAVEARHIGVVQRLIRRARKHKALVAAGIGLFCIIFGLGMYGLRARVLAQRVARESRAQAELAQRLGQQIKDMEWLMRSARQLPLHDLEREKVIVRRRMQKLEAELRTHGALARGLTHYALGRGHLALHEYEAAHAQLQQAIANGQKSAEVYHALGLTLGQLYYQEQPNSQLDSGSIEDAGKLLAPKYLAPAVAALQRSRALELDAPAYLEGLIAYYQSDWPGAIKHAKLALEQAPWLYEASTLIGDAHREQAFQYSTKGNYEGAAEEAAEAIKSYEAAARIGQSDAELYGSLALLLRQEMERATFRGKSMGSNYAAAMAAIDKMATIEPKSAEPPMLKATVVFFALMDLQNGGRPLPKDLLALCMRSGDESFAKQPDSMLTATAAANCYSMAAQASSAGDKAGEYFLRAAQYMRPIVDKHPNFYVGTVNLTETYGLLAQFEQLTGAAEAETHLAMAEKYAERGMAIDPAAHYPLLMALLVQEGRVAFARTNEELEAILTRAAALLEKCKAINAKNPTPFTNYFSISVRAAWRLYLAGRDPRPILERARPSLEAARKLSDFVITLEQQSALLHVMTADLHVREGRDPAPALAAAETSIKRCLDSAGQDARCHTAAARASLVAAAWQTKLKHWPRPLLTQALDQATAATQSNEIYPDAWQVLAEVQLRIAEAEVKNPLQREAQLAAGLSSIDKVLAKNPRHALAHATRGQLFMRRAQETRDGDAQRKAWQSAAAAFEQAMTLDPLLQPVYAPLLAQARSGKAAE